MMRPTVIVKAPLAEKTTVSTSEWHNDVEKSYPAGYQKNQNTHESEKQMPALLTLGKMELTSRVL